VAANFKPKGTFPGGKKKMIINQFQSLHSSALYEIYYKFSTGKITERNFQLTLLCAQRKLSKGKLQKALFWTKKPTEKVDFYIKNVNARL